MGLTEDSWQDQLLVLCTGEIWVSVKLSGVTWVTGCHAREILFSVMLTGESSASVRIAMETWVSVKLARYT